MDIYIYIVCELTKKILTLEVFHLTFARGSAFYHVVAMFKVKVFVALYRRAIVHTKECGLSSIVSKCLIPIEFFPSCLVIYQMRPPFGALELWSLKGLRIIISTRDYKFV